MDSLAFVCGGVEQDDDDARDTRRTVLSKQQQQQPKKKETKKNRARSNAMQKNSSMVDSSSSLLLGEHEFQDPTQNNSRKTPQHPMIQQPSSKKKKRASLEHLSATVFPASATTTAQSYSGTTAVTQSLQNKNGRSNTNEKLSPGGGKHEILDSKGYNNSDGTMRHRKRSMDTVSRSSIPNRNRASQMNQDRNHRWMVLEHDERLSSSVFRATPQPRKESLLLNSLDSVEKSQSSSSNTDEDDEDDFDPVASDETWTELMAAAHLVQDVGHAFILELEHQHQLAGLGRRSNIDNNNHNNTTRTTLSIAKKTCLQTCIANAYNELVQSNQHVLENMDLVGERRKLLSKSKRDQEALAVLRTQLRTIQAANQRLEARFAMQRADMDTHAAASRFLADIDSLRGREDNDDKDMPEKVTF